MLYIKLIQCRHLITELKAWADWEKYTTTCPIATKFAGHGCMYDIKYDNRSFDLQATWVSDTTRQTSALLYCNHMNAYILVFAL